MKTDLQLELVRKQFERAQSYAEEYDRDSPVAHFLNIRLQRVLELMGDLEACRVLDIGCGPAVIGTKFVGKSVEYYGIDVSEDMIFESTRRFDKNPKFEFCLGTVEKLPFADDSFDFVLCLGALEYVLDCDVAISEMARVLKPNGVLIVTMVNKISPYRLWQRNVYWKLIGVTNKVKRIINRNEKQEIPTMPKNTLYTADKLEYLLSSNNMEILDVVYYGFNIMPAPLDVKMPRISSVLARNLEFLCRSRLRFVGTGYLMKGVKIGEEIQREPRRKRQPSKPPLRP